MNMAQSLKSYMMQIFPSLDIWVVTSICHSNHWNENIVCSNHLANSLFEFAEKHGLEFHSGGEGYTHQPHNGSKPSIIDLVFLPLEDRGSIIPSESQGGLDHWPLTTYIRFSILEDTLLLQIKKNSEEEAAFWMDLVESLALILILMGTL